MPRTALDKIEQDAYAYAEGWGDDDDELSFKAGAIAERNKIVDELLQKESKEVYRNLPDHIFTFTRRELESMKIKET